MPFVPAVLPALDIVRSVGGILGLRVYTVTVRQRVWSGERPGLGGYSDTDTVLTNQGPGGTLYNVRLRYVSSRDVIASGGKFRDRDMRVGPMTASYAASIGLNAGGWTEATVDATPYNSLPQEIFWNVVGPDTPAAGIWCEKIEERANSMHYEVVLRNGGAVP